jgi:hypothetical protein
LDGKAVVLMIMLLPVTVPELGNAQKKFAFPYGVEPCNNTEGVMQVKVLFDTAKLITGAFVYCKTVTGTLLSQLLERS